MEKLETEEWVFDESIMERRKRTVADDIYAIRIKEALGYYE